MSKKLYCLNSSQLTRQVSQADILIAAIGIPNYVKGEWLKPGVVVIDVGINYIPGHLNLNSI
jgi:methylenetetrahydrofolate dehydrogenase (NADP+) / methenyltetrahydrofolate cyclohydrolase / formyltetrahydrofolate synthetase